VKPHRYIKFFQARAQSESVTRLGNIMMMLRPALLILLLSLATTNIEATGPVVSNNEWTPVAASQRVRLPQNVIARY
jgi:hypothetical protein